MQEWVGCFLAILYSMLGTTDHVDELAHVHTCVLGIYSIIKTTSGTRVKGRLCGWGDDGILYDRVCMESQSGWRHTHTHTKEAYLTW